MKEPTLIELTAYDPHYHHAIAELLAQLTPHPLPMSEAQLRRVVEDTASHLYLLLTEERVVGMLTLGLYHSPTGAKGWIEDVVVHSSERGLGYGKMLVQHAIDEARKAGVAQLMLTSNPLRIAANRLYQTMGFQRKETNCYRMVL